MRRSVQSHLSRVQMERKNNGKHSDKIALNRYTPPKALLFDLYGTLLDFNQRAFIKELASFLDISPRTVAKKLLGDALTKDFESEYHIIQDFLHSSLPEHRINADISAKCLDILRKHCATISIKKNTLVILSYLKAKGYRLGLVTNLAQPFIEPVFRFRLNEFFETMVFSCRVGVAKPQKSIYELALQELGVSPKETVFIGDSVINDYEGPMHAGMQSILIKKNNLDTQLRSIDDIRDLAWLDFNGASKKIIYPSQKIYMKNSRFMLNNIDILPEEQAGRYNIIATGTLRAEKYHINNLEVFIKRFASDNTAPVEKLAYDAYELLGLSNCHAEVLPGKDSILMTTAVTGRHWQEEDIDHLAFEFGKQTAMAYIIAYADFRPRNTLVQNRDGKLSLQVIDLEHCFFSVAMDHTTLSDVFNPETFNSIDESELEKMKKKLVLSPKHMRRAVYSFLSESGLSKQAVQGYEEGWRHTYRQARSRVHDLKDLLLSRIAQKPILVIGTRGYRRAMANIDANEVIKRVHENPEDIIKLTI